MIYTAEQYETLKQHLEKIDELWHPIDDELKALRELNLITPGISNDIISHYNHMAEWLNRQAQSYVSITNRQENPSRSLTALDGIIADVRSARNLPAVDLLESVGIDSNSDHGREILHGSYNCATAEELQKILRHLGIKLEPIGFTVVEPATSQVS